MMIINTLRFLEKVGFKTDIADSLTYLTEAVLILGLVQGINKALNEMRKSRKKRG